MVPTYISYHLECCWWPDLWPLPLITEWVYYWWPDMLLTWPSSTTSISTTRPQSTHLSLSTSGLMYLLVPTLGLLLMLISPVVCVCITARPKSAITQAPFSCLGVEGKILMEGVGRERFLDISWYFLRIMRRNLMFLVI